jgi:nucleotide-binding universal stress UspA family protein
MNEVIQVQNDRPAGRIVVGVDGSPQATKAIDWALEESRVHGDEVILVHAWQYPALALTGYAGETLPVFGDEDLKRLAEEFLAASTEEVRKRAPDVHVDSRLVKGHPAAALVETSGDARLLVVGTRGLGGLKGMLLGSVSTACAHHARCPVVIVPEQTPTP